MKIPGLYNGTNKTFFMFNGEKYREGTPAAQFSSVPTAAMRNGDFSKLVDAQGRPIIIYDPATGRDVNGVWTRDPFPGNIIPADRINPVAKALLQYYPAPNCTTPGQPDWQQNLCYTEHFNKDVFWNWVGKVDHNFSQNDRVFFRYGKNARHEVRNTTAIRSGPAQNGQLPLLRGNDAFVGDWVHILGSGTVFNVRGSYTYYLEGSQSDYAFGYDATQLGWPASLVSQFPAAQVGGHVPRGQPWTISSRCRADSGRTRTRSIRFSRTSRSRAAITTCAVVSTPGSPTCSTPTTAMRADSSISPAPPLLAVR